MAITMSKLYKYITDSKYRFLINADRGLYNSMPDDEYLKKCFAVVMGYQLDLDNPQTFNEKLQWLKLYDRKPIYTTMVDKYEVKKYVAVTIGEKYIIPTLGIWDKAEDIDFAALPNQFVLKCTHDSGGLVICRDKTKLDIANAKQKLTNFLHRNYYKKWREWPYKKVKPRIIAEKYMEDTATQNSELTDYKFMCFGGEVKCSFVCTERFSKDGLKVTFFDRDWTKMPFERHYPASTKEIQKPVNYEKMIELAEKLSKDIPFVRVDFYETNNQIYFGELTFYPGNGLEEFTPIDWDYTLGRWIDLPDFFGGVKTDVR